VNKTKIDYLDMTWNPIAMRCTPISEGCANCWHLRMADRFAANPLFSEKRRRVYAGGGPPILIETELEAPLRRKKPARIGVQFMGDFFHESVSLGVQSKVFWVIRRCPRHTFLILTKRAGQMRFMDQMAGIPCLDNLWFGVTAENQDVAAERILFLLQTRAAVRFASVEPMLGPVDLTRLAVGPLPGYWRGGTLNALDSRIGPSGGPYKHLDWVIVGCESGPKRRPMKVEWAVDLVRQCRAASVPVFVKQIEIDGKVSHDPAEWPPELRVREYPAREASHA